MGLAGGVVNDPTTGGTGTMRTVEVEGRRRHPGWYLKVLCPTGVGDAERLGAGRDCSRRRRDTGHHRPDRSHRDHHGHHRPDTNSCGHAACYEHHSPRIRGLPRLRNV